MKKIKILIFLLMFSLLPLSLFSVKANGKYLPAVNFSPDLSTLRYDDISYTKVDGTFLYNEFETELEFNPNFGTSISGLKNLYLEGTDDLTFIKATLFSTSGDIVTSVYVKSSKKESFDLADNYDYYVMDYPYYYDKTEIDEEELRNNIYSKSFQYVYFSASEFNSYEVISEYNGIQIIKGFILEKVDGEIYYVDASRSNIIHYDYFYPYNKELKAIKLEDKNIFENLPVESDDELHILSIVLVIFFSFMLILIPIATLILGIIFAIKSKGKAYKKLWIAVICLSTLCLIITTIVIFILFGI